MALVGPFQMPDGVLIPEAYWQAWVTGPIARPLLTVNLYASADARASGKPPVTQLPVGYIQIKPDKPTGAQVYALIQKRWPGLVKHLAPETSA